VKILDSSELSGYMKAQQAHAVRGLRQAQGVYPKFVVLTGFNDLSANGLQAYANDVLVDCDVRRVDGESVAETLATINQDDSIHGVLTTQPVAERIEPTKDLYGWSETSSSDNPVALAVLWLLAGYNIDLAGKQALLVGESAWMNPGLSVLLAAGMAAESLTCDDTALVDKVKIADIVICGSGPANCLDADWFQPQAVIIDTTEPTQSSLIPSATYDRADLRGTASDTRLEPLVESAVIENVIRATRRSIEETKG
jgi:5,10-methylene-tetrahydrofolate dehydrogenase/methenyl tetrahydrofolate cyclohydrolase